MTPLRSGVRPEVVAAGTMLYRLASWAAMATEEVPSMQTRRQWQDWVNFFLGFWLIFAPMFAAGHVHAAAAWNSYLFGAIVAMLSATALYRQQLWEEWANLAIGLWLLVIPFAFGYTFDGAMMWNSIIVGLLITFGTLWAVISQIHASFHEPSHHMYALVQGVSGDVMDRGERSPK